MNKFGYSYKCVHCKEVEHNVSKRKSLDPNRACFNCKRKRKQTASVKYYQQVKKLQHAI